MLLKRLASSLRDNAAALIPLLDPQIRTTEALLTTPKANLLHIVVAALSLPETVEGARIAAACDTALDVLLEQCNSVSVKSGLEVRDEGEGGWEGLGVLREVEWDGRGVLAVSGGKGCGKSLLSLHATLRLLIAQPTATARWVDTEGSFNASRAQAVLDLLGANSNVLERLTVSRAFRLEPELFDILDEVRSDANVKALVIDNITVLFHDGLMSSTAQGHAAMVSAMEEVSELAYSKGITAIVTNSPASSIPENPLSAFSATSVKPSLGRAFTYTADVELLLQDTGKVFGLADENERDRSSLAPGLRVLVEVLKSRVSPSGVWGVIETDGTSLRDVVPPPEHSEQTMYRSAGGATGRPTHGGLSTTITPGIAPLREKRYL